MIRERNEFGNRANIVHLTNIRVAPRKLRVLVDMIRDMDVEQAIVALRFSDRSAAEPLRKLLESGVANVRACIKDWEPSSLVVSRGWVDEGPTMRRFSARAQGRSARIHKRTSQVTLELRPEAG